MSVFSELRDAFRLAVENFKEELHREPSKDTVDGLLRDMGREIVEARTHLSRLEEEVRSALERAEAEKAEAETCRRRERLAREIDDEETARVAREFAEKHERRREVLEQKALALKDELDLRRVEVREMLERLDDARTRREGLDAASGRTRARGSLRDADDLFAELDRMAEKVEDLERRARAAGEVEEALADDAAGPAREPGPSPEARLRELKRRMADADEDAPGVG